MARKRRSEPKSYKQNPHGTTEPVGKHVAPSRGPAPPGSHGFTGSVTETGRKDDLPDGYSAAEKKAALSLMHASSQGSGGQGEDREPEG